MDFSASPVCKLHEIALKAPATVVGVDAPGHAPEWSGWLAEIGFLPGERVQLLGRAVLRVQVREAILGAMAMLGNAAMVATLFILGLEGFTLYPGGLASACVEVGLLPGRTGSKGGR